MGSSFCFLFLFLCCFLSLIISPSIAQNRPRALVLPVIKDLSTPVPQYVTQISQRTPLVPIKLTVDLGARWPWVDCEDHYVSSTYKPGRCGSAQCSLFGLASCGGNICGNSVDNALTGRGTHGQLRQDVASVQSTNGFNPGRMVTTPNYLFVCGWKFVVEGLAHGVTGMVGLGRSKLSLPSQFASVFSLPRKFAICLSSSTREKGVIFFGNGPYHFSPRNIDVSNPLIYTPLLSNPVSTALGSFQGEPSFEYFIGVKSIRIAGKNVPLNTTLLSIDREGNGGTKISTVNPYTVMETTIYKSASEAFTLALGGIPKIIPIAPFSTCFASKDIKFSRLGPIVPTIDLVLQNGKVWSITGANSMVQATNDMICLGFVDARSNPSASLIGFVEGFPNPRTPITIGAHQLENNLLQFDLATSTLGFSNSLLFRQTNCANFNFTTKF